MELMIFKLVISVFAVVGLAEIAKRVDPGLSGVLLGLPLGAGLSVYFIASEQGVDFLVEGIPWAIAGLASSLLFCQGYLIAGLKCKGRFLSMGAGSLLAMAAFFASGALIRGLDLDSWGATLLFAVAATGNLCFLRFFSSMTPATRKSRLSLKELLLRGLMAGTIITGVTVAAPLAGSRWAGILSAFPSTLYALLIIVHYEAGNELYPAIIRNFAHGITALVVFYLGCRSILPVFGLNFGFAIVYCISAVYLYGLYKLTDRLREKRSVMRF